MKPRKPSNSMSERVRSFIHKARLSSRHPNSSPDLVHMIMGPKFQREIAADKDVAQYITAQGWSAEIRAYLKGIPNGDAGDEGMFKDQADFWPDALRQIVIDIDRARVFVPSRMEHVPLMPEAISRDEVKEAGEYLVSKGEECLRVGNRLIQLHEAWS